VGGAEPGGGATVTWRELWADTARAVGDRVRARWLCEVASGADDGDDFLAGLDDRATERMVHHLDAMLARLRGGEPLQYVLGRWGFRRLDLMVDARVLIPRPETELVVEVALDLVASMGAPLRIVDLGTGSGAIGLALATELPRDAAEVWLTDVSEDALDVARANLAGTGRAGTGVRLARGWWFDALPADLAGTFDLVVGNPPYVPDGDARVETVVREWEPHGALYAGPDGLDHLATILAGAPRWLRPGGCLVVEIGAGQGAAVAALADSAGLVDVVVHPDLTGHDRVVQAKRAAT